MHHGNVLEQIDVRITIALLVLFPYLLFRFTNAFRRPNPRLANGLLVLAAVLVVWTFALPRIPTSNEGRSLGFQVWLAVFFIHWTALSVVSAFSLWYAGREQPTVARRRMQSLALALTFLNVALLLALPRSNQDSALSLGSMILALISVVAFFLSFAPPQLLRVVWRGPEQERMQQAIASLLTFAETQEEVAARVVEPAAAIVGARAIAIANAEGGSSPRGTSRAHRGRTSSTASRRGSGRTHASSRSPWPAGAPSSSGRLRMRRSSAG